MGNLSHYDRHSLTERLYLVWRSSGPFKYFSDKTTHPGSHNFIEKFHGKIFTRLYGCTQILYFEEKTEKGGASYAFYVHNVGVLHNEVTGIERAILSRIEVLPAERQKKFRKIFEIPKVMNDEIQFRDEKFPGALIKTPIIELPYGKETRLSDNLYEYGYNCIVLPAFKYIVKGTAPTRDFWYSFMEKKVGWREHLIQ